MGFIVGRNYRTNKLSKMSGGQTVTVVHRDGKVLEYTNIKNPWAYIKTVFKEDCDGSVLTAYVKDKRWRKKVY